MSLLLVVVGIVVLAVDFFAGYKVGAGVITKAEAEFVIVKADVEAEVAKLSPDLTTLVTKIKALLAKL